MYGLMGGREEEGPEEVVFDFSDAHDIVREEVCYVVEEGRPRRPGWRRPDH